VIQSLHNTHFLNDLSFFFKCVQSIGKVAIAYMAQYSMTGWLTQDQVYCLSNIVFYVILLLSIHSEKYCSSSIGSCDMVHGVSECMFISCGNSDECAGYVQV